MEIFEKSEINKEIENQDTIAQEAINALDAAQARADEEELISSDCFYAGFCGAFGTAALFIGSEQLKIQSDEKGARLLSDKIYNLMRENSFLRQMLKNGGLAAFDWFIICAWAAKKTNAVIEEKTGKKAVELVAEKAGKGLFSGVVAKLKFWG